MAVAESVKQLESLESVARPIEHQRVKLATGEAERFHYKMTMQSPRGKPAVLAITQFILVKGAESYIVTLTTLSNQEPRYAATFEKIGQSFRFIN
jgi:hypothetical protein